MERDALRLIATADRTPPGSRPGALALAAFLAGLGLLATLLGADAARSRTDPRERARLTFSDMLSGASTEAELRAELIALRERAARLPLEAQARAAYASLLAAMARDPDGLSAAAFHARVAARLAPVTVPIVRAATLVLAQAGRPDEAADLVRQMFGYDPNAAARLLAVLEPYLPPDALLQALPQTPAAWLARAAVLDGAGRTGEASSLIDEGVERWPSSLDLRARAAGRAAAAGDWIRLERLVPSDLALTDDPASAVLLIHRARLRARNGDVPGAAADLERGTDLAGDTPWLLLAAGDGWLALDRPERSRQVWNRALHASPDGTGGDRAEALRRLARLEEREGRSGTALRLWHELLALVPGDAEATARAGELERRP